MSSARVGLNDTKNEVFVSYRCRACVLVFSELAQLTAHQYSVHPNLCCKTCGIFLPSPEEMHKHLASTHVSKHFCAICNRSFGSVEAHRQHHASVHMFEPFAADQSLPTPVLPGAPKPQSIPQVVVVDDKRPSRSVVAVNNARDCTATACPECGKSFTGCALLPFAAACIQLPTHLQIGTLSTNITLRPMPALRLSHRCPGQSQKTCSRTSEEAHATHGMQMRMRDKHVAVHFCSIEVRTNRRVCRLWLLRRRNMDAEGGDFAWRYLDISDA